MKNIKKSVVNFLQEAFLLNESLTISDDSSFIDEHILDSTGFVELVSFVEREFSIVVRDDELLPENFDSLNKIEAFVSSKQLPRS